MSTVAIPPLTVLESDWLVETEAIKKLSKTNQKHCTNGDLMAHSIVKGWTIGKVMGWGGGGGTGEIQKKSMQGKFE